MLSFVATMRTRFRSRISNCCESDCWPWLNMKTATRGVPFAAVFDIETVECGAAALPACLDITDALIEPFVLRCLDIVLGREAADGARELLDLGFALRDAVLRH